MTQRIVNRTDRLVEEIPGGYSFELAISTSGLKKGDSIPFDIVFYNEDKVVGWNDSYMTSIESEVNTKNFGRLKLYEMPKYIEAPKGTPVMDGIIDYIWKMAPRIDVNICTEGTLGSTAKARMLWDESYVYILMQVKDSNLTNISSNTWEQDSVEVFLDENNNKTATYEKDDVQYRISYTNDVSINGSGNLDDLISFTRTNPDGYVVEIGVPYQLASFAVGQVTGFELQVNNDDNADGSRDSAANWNDRTGMGWSSTEGYGILKLID